MFILASIMMLAGVAAQLPDFDGYFRVDDTTPKYDTNLHLFTTTVAGDPNFSEQVVATLRTVEATRKLTAAPPLASRRNTMPRRN